MQVSFHEVASIKPGDINEYYQPDGIAFYTRRLAIIDKKGRVDLVVVFGDTEAALALTGEKPAEARLNAYADQAREPYVAPELTRNPACPRCNFPFEEVKVDLAAEANPPRFQAGDRVTPIQSKMYIGIIATVEDASPDGLYVRFTEGNRRWFPASLFRLADPGPLAEANPPKHRADCWSASCKGCLPETDAAVDLIAEARDYPTMFGDPPGGPPAAAVDLAAEAASEGNPPF